MPNDARLGLVVGVTLVILIAVLFFAKDGKTTVAAGNVQTPPATTRPPGPGGGPAPAPGAARLPQKVRSHKVREGESLSSVSKQYYGDGAARVSFLFHANRDKLRAPDYVPIGTVLLVPDLPADIAEQDE